MLKSDRLVLKMELMTDGNISTFYQIGFENNLGYAILFPVASDRIK